MALKATMLTCIAAVAMATAVHATPSRSDEMRHSAAVYFSDLSFNRPADVAALYERINFAADQVCGPRATTGSYSTSPGYLRCHAKAIEEAVARVNRPELTAFHAQHLAQDGKASRLAGQKSMYGR